MVEPDDAGNMMVQEGMREALKELKRVYTLFNEGGRGCCLDDVQCSALSKVCFYLLDAVKVTVEVLAGEEDVNQDVIEAFYEAMEACKSS